MIKEKIPITIAETIEISGEKEKSKKLKSFMKEFKDFTILDKKKSDELKNKLDSLNIYKLNEEAIVSLINFIPKDAQDVMKILPEISLNLEEINKILGVFKEV